MRLFAMSNNIRIHLIKQGLTLTDLSTSVNSDLSYISTVINGKRNPSPKLAKRIADTLGVEIEEIFTIEAKKEAN